MLKPLGVRFLESAVAQRTNVGLVTHRSQDQSALSFSLPLFHRCFQGGFDEYGYIRSIQKADQFEELPDRFPGVVCPVLVPPFSSLPSTPPPLLRPKHPSWTRLTASLQLAFAR